MKKIDALLLIIAAFVTGFFVSQYYNSTLRGNSFLTPNQVVSSNQSPELASQQSVSSSSAELQQKTESVGESFSWNNIHQLVDTAQYKEAATLLNTYVEDNKNSVEAWLLLAHIYKKQSQPVAALDAWFHYLALEMDAQKADQAIRDIKNYLTQLAENPSLFNEDWQWLIAQLDKLLTYRTNDGELHLMMASLYIKANDNYQAQYHALMAANDPVAQKRAEEILASLNGEKISEGLSIPLTRYGQQFLVNVFIEGTSARLLLDTGASLSGLSNTFTAQYPFLVKAAKPIILNTASGSQSSFLFTVNNISIGSLVFNQHILAQLPMDNAQGFDGLLGVDILGQFDFVIDQNASVLHLNPRKK